MSDRAVLVQVAVDSCDPPHRVTHEEKLHALVQSIGSDGWSGPPLVGYATVGGRVQLISGSHRWAAVKWLKHAGVPVRVYPEAYVRQVWGTPAWEAMLA